MTGISGAQTTVRVLSRYNAPNTCCGRALFDTGFEILFGGMRNWKIGGGGTYRQRYELSDENGTFVYFGSQAHVLVAHTGRACAALRERGLLRKLIHATADSASRIDVAADMVTEITPQDFLGYGYRRNRRARRSYDDTGGKGETIGTRGVSDRFCRVYRYNPPHPRSDKLRVEFEHRGRLAPVTAKWCGYYGPERIAAMEQNQYLFQCPLWTPETVEETLSRPQEHRGSAKTLQWLLRSVKPAVRRLWVSGAVDRAWIEEHFMFDELAQQKEMYSDE